MPRSRSLDRNRAYEIWSANDGQITNREIAKQLGVPERSVGGWKAKDKWNERLYGVLQSSERSTPKRSGAPIGNQNAAGNTGGLGGPVGNDKAVRHGFFRRIFPDDDETRAIVNDISEMNSLDILWQNIVIQYTAIARSQRIMFVEDAEDHTQVLKSRRDSDSTEEREWEYQFAWDKHANFLKAQSRAMSTLEGLITRYESLLPTSPNADEHRWRIQKLQAEVEKLRGGGELPDGLNVTVDYGDDNA